MCGLPAKWPLVRKGCFDVSGIFHQQNMDPPTPYLMVTKCRPFSHHHPPAHPALECSRNSGSRGAKSGPPHQVPLMAHTDSSAHLGTICDVGSWGPIRSRFPSHSIPFLAAGLGARPFITAHGWDPGVASPVLLYPGQSQVLGGG